MIKSAIVGVSLSVRHEITQSVNLPRWGLKQDKGTDIKSILGCKFTPLGFETKYYRKNLCFYRV